MSVTLLSDATPGASVKCLTSNVALAASTTVALTELNVAVNAGDDGTPGCRQRAGGEPRQRAEGLGFPRSAG